MKRKLSPHPYEAGESSSSGSRRPGHPHSTPWWSCERAKTNRTNLTTHVIQDSTPCPRQYLHAPVYMIYVYVMYICIWGEGISSMSIDWLNRLILTIVEFSHDKLMSKSIPRSQGRKTLSGRGKRTTRYSKQLRENVNDTEGNRLCV